MNVSFHPDAKSELLHAVNYYEDIHSGLGLEFSVEVHDTIERILSYPEAWAKVSEEIRRCQVNRFPYGVLYSVEEDEIYVLAIMNLNKEPGYWKDRKDDE